MSTEPVEDPSHASRAVLSDQIWKRLGNLLATAYAQEDAELDAAGHFADLLAKLDIAFGEARSRDEAEFQRQFLTVAPSLRRFAISLAHDVTAADDLVQDTLLRAWRNQSSFQPGTNFEAWTFTILRNAFYSGRRKHRKVEDEDGSYTARLAIPPDQAGRLDLQDVRTALDRLAPVMREALVLVTIKDLSYDEAAVVMGCQVGTVKSRVWRARDQLARALGYPATEIGSDGVMLSALGGSSEVGR
ncbi:RNA polymerase sigma-70 factor, ECF subfamily [Methylobacterium phyllostachyos]|uniref:RNA polymerase sigma-70 factor, ECF subfamily n=1 Tax=Methylobacterium phyllostachyos TaxID=582672 RepID=A0A1H0JN35_9HYPH|nr:sigma-70 family RNA polymerase sigma factor [Methylobacterium phyllostachyos]SDO44952.1 RNA polymerase sigma-70 factor, ECF subfamily [Methylobacterium phyllostachyos]